MPNAKKSPKTAILRKTKAFGEEEFGVANPLALIERIWLARDASPDPIPDHPTRRYTSRRIG